MRLSERTTAVALVLLLLASGPGALAAVAAEGAQAPDTTRMSKLELMAWRARQAAGEGADEERAEMPPVPEGVTRLTDTPQDEMSPCWSPDGEAVYYTARKEGRLRIYRLDLESGQTEAVTDSVWPAKHPDISPDGRYLVYSRRMLEVGDKLWVLRLEDGETAKLTPEMSLSGETFPRWSSSGMKVYYELSTVGSMSNQGMVVGRDGESRKVLLHDAGNHSHPAVSRDGKKIAWVHRLGRKSAIRVVDSTISALVEDYTVPGNFFGGVEWLPGNRRLLVTYLSEADPKRGYDLGVLDLDTMQVTHLLDLGRGEMDQRVSPDGKRFVFRADREGQSELYLYELP